MSHFVDLGDLKVETKDGRNDLIWKFSSNINSLRRKLYQMFSFLTLISLIHPSCSLAWHFMGYGPNYILRFCFKIKFNIFLISSLMDTFPELVNSSVKFKIRFVDVVWTREREAWSLHWIMLSWDGDVGPEFLTGFFNDLWAAFLTTW